MSLFPSDLPALRHPSDGGRGPYPRSPVIPPGLAGHPLWFTDGRTILGGALASMGLKARFDSLKGLTESRAKEVVERLILSGRAAYRSLSERLVNGSVGLGKWFMTLLRDIPGRHVAAAMALLGTDEPKVVDRGVIASQVGRQVGFLARFRDQVRAGTQAIAEGLVGRSALYSDAAWSTAHNVLMDRKYRDGFGEGRRILGASDHCGGCVREANRGWLPLSRIAPIGSQPCMSRCHCTIAFRRGRGTDPESAPPPPPLSAGVRFVPSPKAEDAGDVTIHADVGKLDAAWAKDRPFYIPRGGGGAEIAGRAAGFRAFLGRAGADRVPVEQPRITIDADGTVSFTDGRHRFVVLRDMGLTAIPVSVDRADVRRARKLR